MQTLHIHQVTSEQTHFSHCNPYLLSPMSEDISTSQDDNEQRCRISSYSNDVDNPEVGIKGEGKSRSQTSAAKPRVDHTKQKSELCRTFLEKGYCPYNQKCKFAHGSHQLRQNQEFNSRYKTKECGSFFKRGFCCYGNRCNFVHAKIETPATKLDKQTKTWSTIMKNHRKLVSECRTSSRLLKILEQSAEY